MIQRYNVGRIDQTYPSPHGTYVTYADAEAAVAAARAEGENHATRVLSASNYQQGVKDGVKAARDAVWEVVTDIDVSDYEARHAAVPAIDALKGES